MSVAGGLLLLVFFCQLGQFPELDWGGASAILMAVATLGFAFSLGLTGCALGAGIALLTKDEATRDLRSGKGVLLLCLPAWLMIAGLAFIFQFDSSADLSGWFTGAISSLVLLLAIWYGQRPLIKKGWPKAVPTTRSLWVDRGATYMMNAALWVATALSALLTLVAVFSRSPEAGNFSVALIIWCSWCFIANAGIALIDRFSLPKRLIVASLSSLFVLLFLAENGSSISRAAVKTLGLGDMPVSLLVTAEGCEIMNRAARQKVCHTDPWSKISVVCPAILRSRIGTPLFIQLSGYDEKGRWPQYEPAKHLQAIALPKSEVRAWTALAPMPSASAPGTRASDAIVTVHSEVDQGAWLRQQCGRSS